MLNRTHYNNIISYKDIKFVCLCEKVLSVGDLVSSKQTLFGTGYVCVKCLAIFILLFGSGRDITKKYPADRFFAIFSHHSPVFIFIRVGIFFDPIFGTRPRELG